jgi:uncharacterized protein YuzE
MRFHYDKKIDALYIRFNEKRYVESDEVSDGIIFDYDRDGKIIGIEVLDASKRLPQEFGSKLRKKSLPVVFELKQKAPLRS